VFLDGEAAPMKKVHPTGFYFASFDGEPRRYRLRAKMADGPACEFEDPYRFPILITDFDLHLYSEGTKVRGARAGCSFLGLGSFCKFPFFQARLPAGMRGFRAVGAGKPTFSLCGQMRLLGTGYGSSGE
jgi:hypothetical protein